MGEAAQNERHAVGGLLENVQYSIVGNVVLAFSCQARWASTIPNVRLALAIEDGVRDFDARARELGSGVRPPYVEK